MQVIFIAFIWIRKKFNDFDKLYENDALFKCKLGIFLFISFIKLRLCFCGNFMEINFRWRVYREAVNVINSKFIYSILIEYGTCWPLLLLRDFEIERSFSNFFGFASAIFFASCSFFSTNLGKKPEDNEMVVKKTYAKPAITSIKELLPAPEGPIIAVSSPARNSPYRLLRMDFVSEINKLQRLIFHEGKN